MDTNATGRFIAELRKQKGYTQKELAEKIMVTEKAISRWETGKGLPNTALLKPLADVLGVSVGELLSGNHIEVPQMKEQTDKVIVDSLNYAKRMLASIMKAVILIIGCALMISPLFVAGGTFVWIVGVVIVLAEVICSYMQRRGYSMKLTNKTYYLLAVVSQTVALILEALPIGVVMVFATGPNEQVTEICSYFSLLPWGYANFTPMLTGILTFVMILLGVISLIRFDNASKYRRITFVCSGIAFLLSLVPLLIFGSTGMNMASYTISGMICLSICLQAVANRNE